MTIRTRYAADLLACAAALAFCPAAPAQTAPQAFEAASVKLSTSCGDDGGKGGRGGGGSSASPGRLDLKCRTVTDLIQMAYGQFASGTRRTAGRSVPIEGGPAWIHSDRYDVDAATDRPQSQEVLRGPMLQALLEDRFRLKIHHDTREVPVYALTVAKGGPKLVVTKEGSCYVVDRDHPARLAAPKQSGPWPCGIFAPSGTNDGSTMYGTTLANFCAQISLVLDRNVIDRTGIAGVFDIHVDAPGPAAAPDSVDLASAIAIAVQKAGLKLESTREPGEFLVIDRVERPSRN